MSEIAPIISQLGFPIFVAIWMLYKTSKDSEALKDTIADLKNSITVLTTLIQEKDGGIK